jgi:diacylglycerol kinase (ATP)
MKNKHFWDNFLNAMRGITTAVKNERHMKFHVFAACLVIFLSIYYRISKMEFIAVFNTISAVITAEMINTAIEATVDLATSEFNEKAKIAKDVAAGAVLVSAIFSAIIGFFIFMTGF